ncbi:ubiquinol-cytochrome c reductase iron-sulfur subunit [hydrocarbon metagenome]|uniref:Ubiquinol-cytochrome c reductase iron-sulfur subunit n=1 Tax=hydrocarbon metagenome TaxID=938273 RepID=A0A0W8FWQ0_9ZZZZ
MDNNDKKKSRREFISKSLFGGGLLASAGVILHHGIKFIFPEEKEKRSRKLLVGRVDELKIGEAKEVNIGDRSLFLVHTNDGYKVLSAICTHLGCKIKWEGHRDRFYCACHQGIFSPSGDVVSGPPPEPLEEFKVEIDKNLVYMWIEETTGGIV